MLQNLRGAVVRLSQGKTISENFEDHDALLGAFATASVRAEHIAGRGNPAEKILGDGIMALSGSHARHHVDGIWILSDEERRQIQKALDAYESILLASSPLQMEKAYLQHLDELRAQLLRLKEVPPGSD